MGYILCDDWDLFVLLAPDNNSRLRQRRLCSCVEDLRCLCVVHACVYRVCIPVWAYVCDLTRLLFYMQSVFDCYLVVRNWSVTLTC